MNAVRAELFLAVDQNRLEESKDDSHAAQAAIATPSAAAIQSAARAPRASPRGTGGWSIGTSRPAREAARLTTRGR